MQGVAPFCEHLAVDTRSQPVTRVLNIGHLPENAIEIRFGQKKTISGQFMHFSNHFIPQKTAWCSGICQITE